MLAFVLAAATMQVGSGSFPAEPESIQLNVRRAPDGSCAVYWGSLKVGTPEFDRAVAKLRERADGQGNVNSKRAELPEVHIQGDTNTPYRCIGGAIYTMQLGGFSRIGFISEPPPDAAVPPAIRALHERLLVLDTHLDTPVNLGRPGWDFAQRHSFTDDISQIDLPRMKEGGLDGGFFVIYTQQGPLTPEGYAAAKAHAWRREAWIRALVRQLPNDMELAFTPDDARRIAAKGKRVVFQSIENSYPLGPTVATMKDFYDAGVRLAGPVHNGDNQFADAAKGGKRTWGGLSPLGREWVKEANRLGILIDLSHSSDQTVDQVLELSKAPVILSHSGPRALYDSPRNLDDARIRKIAAKGGVIQVNSVFLAPMDDRPERDKLSGQWESLEDASPREAREAGQAWARLEATKTANPVTFDRFMESLLYVLKLVGPDHVGIGMDWDGGGGLIGMNDISGLPRITAALKAAGYSDTDIAKIWSGNLLRALGEAQRLAEK